MAHIQSESFEEDGRWYLDTKPLPVPVDPSYNAPPSGFMERIRIGGPYSSQKEADYWSKRASDVQGEEGSVEDYKRFLSPYRENTMDVFEFLSKQGEKYSLSTGSVDDLYIPENLGQRLVSPDQRRFEEYKDVLSDLNHPQEARRQSARRAKNDLIQSQIQAKKQLEHL